MVTGYGIYSRACPDVLLERVRAETREAALAAAIAGVERLGNPEHVAWARANWYAESLIVMGMGGGVMTFRCLCCPAVFPQFTEWHAHVEALHGKAIALARIDEAETFADDIMVVGLASRPSAAAAESVRM